MSVAGPAQASPLLERVGLRYLRRRGPLPVPASSDPVHVLNAQELGAMRRVARGAVARAAAAGALSSLAAALAEVGTRHWLDGPEPAGTLATFWVHLAGVTVLASVAEIAFLYGDALRSVHRLSALAGVEILGPEARHGDLRLAAALVRAALELPGPQRPHRGIDPRREVRRWRLLAGSLLYKVKVSASSFVLKALLGRALSRAALRAAVLPFVAMPVTAAWDALVCWWVLREARLRAIGPSAARELVALALPPDGAALAPEARLLALRAVGCAVVATGAFHPNHLALLDEAVARLGEPPEGTRLDDTAAFVVALRGAPPEAQGLAVRVLVIALAIDGRLTGPERRLLARAQRAAGLPDQLPAARHLRRAVVAGLGFDAADVTAAGR